MKKYMIRLVGCDDTTIFEMLLTDDQFAFLQTVAKVSKETSEYGCQPVMEVELHPQSAALDELIATDAFLITEPDVLTPPANDDSVEPE